MKNIFASVLSASLLAGCASVKYSETPQATFSGALDVRWIKNDYFLFVPDPADPFTITRKSGQKIQPGRMYTDGGSIPRFLWGVKGLSPWGYAPAYIAHDWVFTVHQCGLDPPRNSQPFSFEDSIAIMAESLKAVMENDRDARDYFVFDSVVQGVASPIAFRLWNGGSCKRPPPELKSFVEGTETPSDFVMRIDFSSKN